VRHVLVNGTAVRTNGVQVGSLEQRPGVRPAIA
jgi:hypothetical protein